METLSLLSFAVGGKNPFIETTPRGSMKQASLLHVSDLLGSSALSCHRMCSEFQHYNPIVHSSRILSSVKLIKQNFIVGERVKECFSTVVDTVIVRSLKPNQQSRCSGFQ